MSSVLRKKIEAGVGIPPKLLKCEEFWNEMHSRITGWAIDMLDGPVAPESASRRVVAGDVARDLLDKRSAFFFDSMHSPGLCAIATDEQGVARNAATRLNQDIESAREGSALFLKLLFEAPAVSLWQALAAMLDGHDAGSQRSPLAEYSQATGRFDPSSRYLIVAYTVMPEALQAQVWLVFELDYVLAAAPEAELRAASHRRMAVSGRPRVLEESIMNSPIRVEANFDSFPMTIGECSRLKVGDIVTLPETDQRYASLFAETVGGSVRIGQCEMGVWRRHRAVKLREPVLEPFTQEVAKM